MDIKKTVTQKKIKFNFELNKNIFGNSLLLEKADIEKSVKAISLLSEYIRFCYFENYNFKNSSNLNKYCRLLMKYEKCNQAVICRLYNMTVKSLLSQAIENPYTKKTIDLSINFSSSSNESIYELSETLMRFSLGSHIRGKSF